MSIKLSPNFTLKELTETSTGLPNAPGADETARLIDLCASILESIRAEWGPIRINSGFRCPEVNAQVGGAATSQHVSGEAADIVPLDADIDIVFDWIVHESELSFGQAIREHRPSTGADWIHISLLRENGKNQEALVFDGKGYKPYV